MSAHSAHINSAIRILRIPEVVCSLGNILSLGRGGGSPYPGSTRRSCGLLSRRRTGGGHRQRRGGTGDARNNGQSSKGEVIQFAKRLAQVGKNAARGTPHFSDGWCDDCCTPSS